MAAYITVGAKTTHGGTVISGSSHTTHNGIPVARKGDKVICKKCKKVTTIIGGDASFIIDGAPIARGGDVTSCGAKLIASQQSFAESGFDVGNIAQAVALLFPKSEPDALFASLADTKSDSEDDQYESNIFVTDQDGNPIPEDQRQDWIAGSRGGGGFWLSENQLSRFPELAKRLDKPERFIGDHKATEYLIKHNNDSEQAYNDARNTRDSYKGIYEPDRNAEHYLFALDVARKKQFVVSTAVYTSTYGYSAFKGIVNGVGHVQEKIFGRNVSPFRGTPVTSSELNAGLLGTEDGWENVEKVVGSW